MVRISRSHIKNAHLHAVQLSRLICEIAATQENLDVDSLCEATDLTVEELNSIFERANTVWEEFKQRGLYVPAKRNNVRDTAARVDAIQFARLIFEISATQENLDKDVLCDEMDLDLENLDAMFDQASTVWEGFKQRGYY
jgi:hypothetical protein